MIKDIYSITVIIPMYNVERYIENCARRLLEQTITSIQYIFIDDYSTDATVTVLENVLSKYPNRQKNVKIIKNNKNIGCSLSRKVGLGIAEGKYIAFCDSDDYVSINMYEEMFNYALSNDADVVISDYYVDRNGEISISRACRNSYTKRQILKGLFSQQVPYMLWNKIYKRELLNKVNFPQKIHAEDMAIVIQSIFLADNISYLSTPYYYYRFASDTVMHVNTVENTIRNFNEATENVKVLESFLYQYEIDDMILNGIEYIKMNQRNYLLPLINDSKYYHIWNSTFPEINRRILFNKDIKFKHKLKFAAAKLHLWHYVSWLFR